ncbi:centromere protein H isoform X1 [Synchiropus splendidus]|uniref:centromere protein H isoform X1 n=2 Tax=Synchiropus splendidus TaxID=270530 RepID=UPI00237D61C2|nr:centromere protein H isoform X1 [Synchiropus splendidus]XP_053727338.1 centromere protein H isoform X1 [Synchiropus splendidus]
MSLRRSGMDQCEDIGNLSNMVEGVELNNDPDDSSKKPPVAIDMLRIKQQMSNQCFEMNVHLNTGKSQRSCSSPEPDRELPEYMTELERIKTTYFNSTLTLHRLQMAHAIEESLKDNDAETNELKERCMDLCSRIKQLQLESRALQDEIIDIQKQRHELKRLTNEKMKEIRKVMSNIQNPEVEKYKAPLEKAQSNLEKFKKMAVMIQNIFRGILLAFKVNWMDDPALRDVVMTLEELPISD